MWPCLIYSRSDGLKVLSDVEKKVDWDLEKGGAIPRENLLNKDKVFFRLDIGEVDSFKLFLVDSAYWCFCIRVKFRVMVLNFVIKMAMVGSFTANE